MCAGAWGMVWLAVQGVGTILLAVVAALQDHIRGWVMGPKLDLEVRGEPPDRHRTPLETRVLEVDGQSGHVLGERIVSSADCYYYRFRVLNRGRGTARNVEVYAAELSERQADGSFALVGSFLPMALVWSHRDGQPSSIDLHPGTWRFCDLGKVVDPAKRASIPGEDSPRLGVPSDQAMLSLKVETPSTNRGHLLRPGTYRLTLRVSAANCAKPLTRGMEVSFPGEWFLEERDMLGKGLGLKLLPL